jgi:hypothetical protein
VDYHEFKSAFLDALRDSRLPTIGAAPSDESLDLRNTDRTVMTYVEPLDREIGRPFHVSGAISWRWDALQSARTTTREEDLLTELLGREDAYDIDTERPWLRVDLVLRAGLEYGKWLPMPSTAVWARWMQEVTGRLDNVEPLVPEDLARELPDGQLAILAWQGGPEVKASCSPDGALRLESIKLSAFQLIELPRKWDSPEREPDDHPHAQLVAMFRRVKAALHAWGEVMDHLADT